MSSESNTTAQRTGLERFTSIARPVDPSYLTNRVLLYVLPIAAALSALIASLTGLDPLSMAIRSALVAFVAWALTRELAPDYVEASFVSLGLAWLCSVALGTDQVLTGFAVLLLVRVVNRTPGLTLTLFDTVSVMGFVTFIASRTSEPLLILLMAGVFLCDGVLHRPLRRHLFAAVVSLFLFGWALRDGFQLALTQLDLFDGLMLLLTMIGGVLMVIVNPHPISYYDNAYERLDRRRVNAGFLVGLLAGFAAVLTGGPSAWLATPLWGCLTVVLLTFVGRQCVLHGRAALH
ncbi:MAG: hypothetical protein AAF917_05695 [Pseudomonadota bacterium]